RNHRGVRSKEISGAGRREGNVKRHGLTIHEVPRSLEHGEGSVAFIEMADFGLLSERAQQAPSPDPQHHLLGNPHFRSAAIEFARNAPICRRVCRIIGVEKVELYAPYPDLPGAKPHTKSGQIDGKAQQLPIWLSHGPDR